MTPSHAPVLLEVTGLDVDAWATQSMRNPWLAGRDPEERKLAEVELLVNPVETDLLERLTWGLLAWRPVQRLQLVDRRTGARVAVIRPHTPGSKRNTGRVLTWRDHWLPPGAVVRAGTEDPAENADDVFPPAERAGFIGLNEQSLARRERVWERIVRVLGERMAVFAYRTAQALFERLRRLRATECRLHKAALNALQRLPGCDVRPGVGIAIMTSRLSPGGAEKCALDLALELARDGQVAHVITTFGSRNDWADRARAGGVRVLHLPDFLPADCWTAFVTAYLVRHRLSVLHINNSHWAYEHLLELKTVIPGLRVVSQLHAEGRTGIRDYLSLAAAMDAYIDRHTVISEYLRERLLVRYAIDPAKVSVVRTGIDFGSEFERRRFARGNWRTLHDVPDDRPLVAFVGRFSELKRPLLFLDIAMRLLDSYPNALFALKGEGPLRPAIDRKLARNPRLARAVVVEDSDRAVQPLMVDADLLVLTSAMEGIAYVSYEAMALGLVQVSSDVGAQSELVRRECGILVETGPGETERFVAAIDFLLERPERRAELSREGLRRISQWPRASDMAARYMALYATLDGGRLPLSIIDSDERSTA